jgi:hypothetical protein
MRGSCSCLQPRFNSSCSFQIVLTERANHARDLLQSLPPFNINFPFQIVLMEPANHARDMCCYLPWLVATFRSRLC